MPLQKTKCKKCGYERILRKENPVKCPKCGHKTNARINSTQQLKANLKT